MYVDKAKYKCGKVLPTSCVPYSGRTLTFLTPFSLDVLPCDVNINDVIDRIDLALAQLGTGTNLTTLNSLCLSFDPATVTIVGLHQVEITAICALQTSLNTLTETVDDLNIGNEIITINLGCLTPAAASCAVGTNQYSLLSILSLFSNTLCDIQSRLTAIGA
jgi:hypothetical protein